MNIQSGDRIQQVLVDDLLAIIRKGRDSAYKALNSSMLETYWRIGQRIVQEEQHGEERAEYGSQLLKLLSHELTERLGKGFSARNLAYYRLFYLTFNDIEILHTRVQNLTWSHIRLLLSVTDKDARAWYLGEV